MEILALTVAPLAAAAPLAAIGFSLIYMLGGGGLVGAIVIFLIAKLVGK
jgi:hypothetical protein